LHGRATGWLWASFWPIPANRPDAPIIPESSGDGKGESVGGTGQRAGRRFALAVWTKARERGTLPGNKRKSLPAMAITFSKANRQSNTLISGGFTLGGAGYG